VRVNGIWNVACGVNLTICSSFAPVTLTLTIFQEAVSKLLVFKKQAMSLLSVKNRQELTIELVRESVVFWITEITIASLTIFPFIASVMLTQSSCRQVVSSAVVLNVIFFAVSDIIE